jgi:sec-independent protein translocase protein TatA
MDSLFFMYLGFLNLGPTEIVLILIVAVILFGGRLPDVARSLGKGFFELRKNLKDLQDDIYRSDLSPPKNLPGPYYQDKTENEKASRKEEKDDKGEAESH